RRLHKVPYVLVWSRHQPHWTITRGPSRQVFSEALDVFTVSEFAGLAILQSRVHEIWLRLLSSSMKDDLRYTPTSCFETFPFPVGWRTNRALEQIGERYCQYRAGLMNRTRGLTETYNRFHNKCESDVEIEALRQLHA